MALFEAKMIDTPLGSTSAQVDPATQARIAARKEQLIAQGMSPLRASMVAMTEVAGTTGADSANIVPNTGAPASDLSYIPQQQNFRQNFASGNNLQPMIDTKLIVVVIVILFIVGFVFKSKIG